MVVEPGSEHKGVAKICAWWGSVLTYCATQAAEPWFWPIMTYRFTAHYDLWVYRGFSYVNPPPRRVNLIWKLNWDLILNQMTFRIMIFEMSVCSLFIPGEQVSLAI